ncbi:MAG: glycosyltransferase family 8 protein, partial [Candidatus Eremiobacteraeota bacterium]|nr:glycosyltransferase family 8 protein [Candidatus Eremiobacteraeota bacterium]
YHIALFTSLARDLRYAAVLIRSIAKHFCSPDKLVFHFMFYELEPQELARFTKSLNDLSVQVELHPLSSQVGDRVSKPDFGYWARLWLGRVLPSETERVLYLDCDMIAYRDIQPIWETDMDGHVVAAVEDPGNLLHGCRKSLKTAIDKLNLDFPDPSGRYINSGFLFINLKLWRNERVLERVEETFSDYQALRFHDQDAINLLLGDRVKLLSPEWNLLESVVLYENWDFELYREFDPPQEYFEPRLRHFSGNMKPDGRNARASERELFYSYLDQTLWRGWRSPESESLVIHLYGRLLDFHYVVVRGFKQKALKRPFEKLLSYAWAAPYAPLVYPLLPLYRLIRAWRVSRLKVTT